MNLRPQSLEVLNACGYKQNRDLRTQEIYESLNHFDREIRLLEILPSPDENAVVSCKLLTSSLPANPRYVALSYVWGDPSVTEDIWVNGRSMPVTTNLASA